MKVAILTANTEVYKEREEDKSGKVIRQILKDAGAQVVFAQAVPLDRKVLSTVLQRLAAGHVADLVLTFHAEPGGGRDPGKDADRKPPGKGRGRKRMPGISAAGAYARCTGNKRRGLG